MTSRFLTHHLSELAAVCCRSSAERAKFKLSAELPSRRSLSRSHQERGANNSTALERMQTGSLCSLQACQAGQLCRQTPPLVHARSCSLAQPSRAQPSHQRPSSCRLQSGSLRPARAHRQWICRAQAEDEEEQEDEDDVDPEDIAGVEGLDEDVEDIPEDTLDDERALASQSNYDNEGRRGRGRDSEYEERVIEVSRVTKVVKGGKQLGFRCVLAMGDEKGTVRSASLHV